MRSAILGNHLKSIAVDQDDREVHAVKDDVKKPSGKVIGAKAKHRQTKNLFSCKKC